MSQSQDIAAINDLFLRTTPTNAAAAAIQDAWTTWLGSLPSFERDYDSDTLYAAGLRRDAFNKAMANGAVNAPGPVVAVAPTPKPTIKKGSKDPAGVVNGPVHLWQAIVGAVPDGDFGSKTEALTKTWQKAHGLVNDGVVGPLTWAQAISNGNAAAVTSTTVAAAANQAVQAVLITQAPQTAAAAAVKSVADAVSTQMTANATVTPAAAKEAVATAAALAAANVKAGLPIVSSASGFPVLREGSKGESVKTWQRAIGISPVDGNFGPDTTRSTKLWQTAHGLESDGIVGPASWTAANMPSSGTIPLDAVSVSFDRATAAVKGAFSALHTMTPTWLKATGAVMLGWSGLLVLASMRKPPRT